MRSNRYAPMIRDTSITIEEAAQLGSCSHRTTHRATRHGVLLTCKQVESFLIPESNLNKWFQSKRIHGVKVDWPRRYLQVQGR